MCHALFSFSCQRLARALPFTLGLMAALSTTSASAQTLPTQPDAGSLRQQIERNLPTPLPKKLAPAKPAEPAAMAPAPGVSLTVKEFRLVGNTLLSNAQLQPVLAPWLNRSIGFADLQEAAAAVASAYRQAGWVVRAYLPQQDIDQGIVTLQIVEAVFGGASIEGSAAKRVASEQILRGILAHHKTGEPLNADALDRALLLADDLPGVSVLGSLKEGAAERETALSLRVADEPLTAGYATLDNFGARSTGEERLNANLNLNSPLGRGDLLNGDLIHTQGSDYLRLDLSSPVGPLGWRVGVNASNLRYQLIATEFEALHASAF